MIRAVGFDAAETLFYNEGLVGLLAGWDDSADPRLRTSHLNGAIRTVGGRGLWPPDSATPALRLRRWTRFYALVLAEAGFARPEARERAAACAATVTDAASYAAFDDVPEVLDRLAGLPVRTCVISNFDPLLDDILDRLALRGRFDAIVSSFDVGCYKPDPRIFAAASSRVALPPESFVFVGDSPFSDIQGATRAGMHPVLIDRTGQHRNLTVPTIGHLGELFRWLEKVP